MLSVLDTNSSLNSHLGGLQKEIGCTSLKRSISGFPRVLNETKGKRREKGCVGEGPVRKAQDCISSRGQEKNGIGLGALFKLDVFIH